MKSIKKYCCEEMEKNINDKCPMHNDPFDCPDNLVFYNKKAKEFGIIVHDGGHSYVAINFCPWCGAPLKTEKDD